MLGSSSRIKLNGSNDIALSFGARTDLTNNVLDNIDCDGGALIRGDMDIACPSTMNSRYF
jgi:hypothetical protein